MIEAIIFDLDGTVLDNEPDWEQAYVAVALKHQIPNPKFVQPNGWWHEPGISLSENWRRLVGEMDQARKLTIETVKEYSRLNIQDSIKIRPGIEDLITKVKEAGLGTALSTGSVWHTVEKDLEDLGMTLAFDITTTGDEVARLKPDPEIYTLTVQKLETDPEKCIVIEDAIAGVRSAAEAGCKVVGLISDYATEKILLASGAKLAINGIEELLPVSLGGI